MNRRCLHLGLSWPLFGVLCIGLANVIPPLWHALDARLLAVAAPQLDAKWFNALPGAAKPIEAPTPAIRATREQNSGDFRISLFASGEPHAITFLGADGTPTTITVYDPRDSYDGGVNGTFADVDGDGKPQLVFTPNTSTPFGQVARKFEPNGAFLFQGRVFAENGVGGTTVTDIDADGDKKGGLVFAHLGWLRHVDFPQGVPTLVNQFQPFPAYTGTIEMVGANFDGIVGGELFVAAGNEVALFGYNRAPCPPTALGSSGDPRQCRFEPVELAHARLPFEANIAAGDVDNNDFADFIIANKSAVPGGGPPVVFVFFNRGGVPSIQFTPYDRRGIGVEIAACDTNRDGRAEVITAPKLLDLEEGVYLFLRGFVLGQGHTDVGELFRRDLRKLTLDPSIDCTNLPTSYQ